MYDTLFLTHPLVDMVVPLEDKLPVLAGETKIINTIINEPGGPANILIAGKRLGLNILPMGAVGDDYYGEFILESYKKEGINVSSISIIPNYETRKVIVLVDGTGKHSFISMIDGLLGPLTELEKLIENSKSICVSGYMSASNSTREETMQMIRIAKKANKVIFFDPGPLIASIPKQCMDEILEESTVVVMNEEEAALISGFLEIEKAAEAIKRKTKGIVVIKAGEKGCYILSDMKQGAWYSGFSVPLIDTTGAGDSFLGAFMYAYLSNWDMKTIAHFSNAAGAAKVAKQGSGTQVPTVDEIITVLEQGGFLVPDSIKIDKVFKNIILH